jgi:hypothetical protein
MSLWRHLVLFRNLKRSENIDGGRKCLGNLPDEILRLILSFLPTTDAVRTSILSRRWEYLWVSISSLDFVKELANRSLLMNFVERDDLSS